MEAVNYIVAEEHNTKNVVGVLQYSDGVYGLYITDEAKASLNIIGGFDKKDLSAIANQITDIVNGETSFINKSLKEFLNNIQE